MIRENQKTLNQLQIALDLLLVACSLPLAYELRFRFYEGDYLPFREYLLPLLLLIPLHFFIYQLLGLYEPRRRLSLLTELGKILQANILSLLILLSLLYLIKEIDYSRQVLIFFVVITSTLTLLERVLMRVLLRSLRRKGYNQKHVLIIGAGRLSKKLIIKLKENRQFGYSINGIIDDKVSKGKLLEGIPIIGITDELEEIIRNGHIDEIFITLSPENQDKLKKIIKSCEKSGIRTQIVPDYARYVPAKPLVDDLDGIPLINIRHVPLDNVLKAFAKRTFDFISAFLGLLVILPILLVIAVGIKLDSPGPVIFKQERIGLNKKPFLMYKFRTMKVQAAMDSNEIWTTKGDPRKTKFGNFLRKTSLDELPQLWNVLTGTMSLVGPRPERPYYVKQFQEKIPRYMIKHHVRPGITGWAQVQGWRGDTSIRKRIEADIYYIENWTMALDVKILFLTVFKGFVNRNAY